MGLTPRRGERTKVTDPSKRRAPIQEKERAARLGGRVTKGSGNQTEKGDIRVKGVARVEAKCTRKKSFSVTREMVDKIEDAAASCAEGELPVMHVEFLDPITGAREKGLYLMREDDVEMILGEMRRAKTVD